jgi:hypothetical protein
MGELDNLFALASPTYLRQHGRGCHIVGAPSEAIFLEGVQRPVCLSILGSRQGATHSQLLSVQPPATLFLHQTSISWRDATKNRSLYVASHCNQPAAKSSMEIYG